MYSSVTIDSWRDSHLPVGRSLPAQFLLLAGNRERVREGEREEGKGRGDYKEGRRKRMKRREERAGRMARQVCENGQYRSYVRKTGKV